MELLNVSMLACPQEAWLRLKDFPILHLISSDRSSGGGFDDGCHLASICTPGKTSCCGAETIVSWTLDPVIIRDIVKVHKRTFYLLVAQGETVLAKLGTKQLLAALTHEGLEWSCTKLGDRTYMLSVNQLTREGGSFWDRVA